MTCLATDSKSMRLKHAVNGGIRRTLSSRSYSSGSINFSTLSTVFMSTSPRCLGLGRYLSSVSGGWIGSNSSVASLPAYLRMIFCPPGCSSISCGVSSVSLSSCGSSYLAGIPLHHMLFHGQRPSMSPWNCASQRPRRTILETLLIV